ncbi:beta-ketoacyl-[acyl-carrier-protein] synthase family protein [Microbacterium sp. YY-01]|uniref:beta-ketoacyl-[acyl-carrier-protein] synthase family protein n=1 Tax=Microbacterium sp. YY-01 TaxID=3421634 RepID=UPI003D17DB23
MTTRLLRRAVITGMGVISPSGHSVAALWQAVCEGTSAVRALDDSVFAGLPVQIGATIHGFVSDDSVPHALARRLSPVQLWAVAAADQAMGAARDKLPWPAHRFGILAATGSGPIDATHAATRAFDERGPRAVPIALVMHGAPDAAAAVLSQRYGAHNTAHAITATCASSTLALGQALRRIRHGYADAILVVGMEDCLNPINFAANSNLRALAKGDRQHPDAASRPFDHDREGFVMGQGAAALLIEAENVARERGQQPLAVLTGFGESSDAYHPTAPDPQGQGAALAMEQALVDAELVPSEIDHISAHATGTPRGDEAEAQALRTVFGEHLSGIAITAPKSSTGHLLGASGALEAILAVQSLQTSVIPPTINLDNNDFADLNIVTGRARTRSLRHVLSNSFGFGGHNGTVIITAAPTAADKEHS